MKKLCPLQKEEFIESRCDQDKCAWWVDSIKKCAVCELVFIPIQLKNIATLLEKREYKKL